MAEIALLLLLGVFSGFIAGLLGVGGGLIIVPALLYLLSGSVEQIVLMHTAVATALAVIVFTSISSVRAHHSRSAIHWHNFKKLTPAILLGAFSGALLTKVMSFDFMRIFFALFEFSVAAIMYFGLSSSAHADNLGKWVWRITGYIIGLVSAIVGIGGGTMTTPFLTYNNVDIKNAIATSAAVGMPIAIAGALGFIVAGWNAQGVTNGLGFIHSEAFISIVLMSVLFAPLGARVAHSVDGKKLKKFFAIFLALLGLTVITF
ncbi:MAG: sulfite exporter TauE/SafE family protein [Candidatus Thioglobus sp.]|uniref:sulfite exporter TauE/SafE family protein n=1 Tax=Candidatus Thioglobus sp. TaxID=2026721 RepID=UPI002619F897|nr:sulfite exporter TauE/SafE family protein [Candidatus Thioglobus sp.]MDC9727117.1 sulfite exporter TauE/SafE family protein [Candidatus Thioglobus sp.]